MLAKALKIVADMKKAGEKDNITIMSAVVKKFPKLSAADLQKVTEAVTKK